MTTTTVPARRRVSAFARRALIQQGTTAVWLAALVGERLQLDSGVPGICRGRVR